MIYRTVPKLQNGRLIAVSGRRHLLGRWRWKRKDVSSDDHTLHYPASANIQTRQRRNNDGRETTATAHQFPSSEDKVW